MSAREDPPAPGGPEANPIPGARAASSRPTRIRLGKFLLQKKLGAGGMGAVYQALDESLQRVVALKTILPEYLGDDRLRRRFLAEARSAAKLKHPGIITIYEMGEVEGVPYFSMELIPGDDLATLARRGLAPRRAVELLAQVAVAVGFAHAQGVVHRDLKPANIMVRSSGIPVVMDFGLAKDLETTGKATDLTGAGDIVGTPDYMPPEQVLSDKATIGPATDVYALGVILFELLSGRRPFHAKSPPLIMVKILRDPAPRLVTATLGLPADLEFVIDQCLQKSASKRYPDAGKLALALQDVMAGKSLLKKARLLTLESAPQPSLPAGAKQVAPASPPHAQAASQAPRRGGPRPASAAPAWRTPAGVAGVLLFAVILASGIAYVHWHRKSDVAKRTFDDAVQAAWALARDKRGYEAAWTKLREARHALPSEEYSAKLDEESKKLEAWIEEQKKIEEQAAATRREEESRKRFRAVTQEVNDLARDWDIDNAKRRCDEEMANLVDVDQDQLRKDLSDFESLRALRQQVMDYWAHILSTTNLNPPADKDPRPFVEIDGKPFYICGMAVDLIELVPRDGGKTIKKPWKDVPIAAFYDQVARPAAQAGTGDQHLALGLHLFRNKAYADAEKELLEARKLGKDVDAMLKDLDTRFSLMAGELFGTEQSFIMAGKMRDALAVAMKLKRELGTRAFCKEHSAEIDAALGTVCKEIAAGGDYFPFSDGQEWSQWTTGGSGTWQIEHGVLIASGTKATSERKVPAVAELMLLLQFPDPRTEFTIQLGGGTTAYKMQFNPSSEKVICQGPKGLQPKSFAYADDRWYLVRIEYSEKKVGFYVDEQAIDAIPADSTPEDVSFHIEGPWGPLQGRALMDDVLIRHAR